MQLSVLIKLARSSGLLPAIGVALLIALVVGALAGGAVAWRVKRGQVAIAQNTQLRADAKAADAEAQQQRQASAQQAIETASAQQRLDAITRSNADDQQAQQRFDHDLAADRQAISTARPDLADLDLGPEWLCHWNAANTGRDATAAATACDGADAGAAVPAAADSPQQQRAGDAGTARPGGVPVSHLSGPPAGAGAGHAGVAGHGLALVLPGGPRDRPESGGLPG